MRKLFNLSTAVVVLALNVGTGWAQSPKNQRFQQLKQEMWLTGLNVEQPVQLGEQPMTIEQITQNLPQFADVQEVERFPEELDYVLYKFGHKL